MRPLPSWAALAATLALATACTTTPAREAAHQVGEQGAGPSWVAAENARPGTTDWRITPHTVATDAQLAAFADRASVLPGEPTRLFVSSTSPAVRVAAFRVGWYGGKGGRLVWSSTVPAHRQPDATTAPATRMVSAPWTPTTTVATQGWPEGLYLLKLTASGGVAAGRSRYVPLVVRSATAQGRLVLVDASATDAAYNTWGGRSLYGGGPGARVFAQRSYAVSMDRPYDGDGIRKLSQYALGPVRLAESLGLDLGYLTSSDLERPHVLDGARGLVSLGHDEYWSVAMRRAVEAARAQGTNLAFLGANAAYWRVRFEDSPLGPDRVVVGYKDARLDPLAAQDPAQATTTFRGKPAPDPENSLTGLLYECFPTRADYVVVAPDFPLFRGTGARQGTRVPGLVGAEVDRATPDSTTPAGLEVVAHSPVRCGPRGSTYSDSAYFTSPSGAGTFSTGTMSWALALDGPRSAMRITAATVAFVRVVTANLFRAMAAGPMARAVPATGNLASFRESGSTSSGTGGPVG
jgi:hypothetical protein